MNKLQGIIVGLESEGEISLVEVDVQGVPIHSLVVEAPDAAGHLWPGKRVSLLFKESEVSLAAGPIPSLSIRNRLPCRVKAVAEGSVLSHLELDFHGSILHALITTRASREMGLEPGRPVVALIKSTEVSLGWGDP